MVLPVLKLVWLKLVPVDSGAIKLVNVLDAFILQEQIKFYYRTNRSKNNPGVVCAWTFQPEALDRDVWMHNMWNSRLIPTVRQVTTVMLIIIPSAGLNDILTVGASDT